MLQHLMIGKKQLDLSNHLINAKGPIIDALVANERIESRDSIENLNFDLSIFTNVSFKSSKLKSCILKHSVFVNCYFRQAELSNIDFTGSQFISCNFNRVKLRNCKFDYCSFKDCFIPFEELEFSLPQEPNLKKMLCRNLKIQAANLGAKEQFKSYFEGEMYAEETHLLNIIKRKSSYYKDKYNLCDSAVSSLRYVGMKISKRIWGYGEHLTPLILTSLIITPLAFSFVYWFVPGFLQGGNSVTMNWVDSFALSYCTISSNCMQDYSASTSLMGALRVVHSILNLTFFGLFVSGLYKWIQR